MDVEAIVADIDKPRVKDVLRLTRFVAGKLETLTVELDDLKDSKSAGFALVKSLLNDLNEDDLVELGKILLGDNGSELTAEDLDIGWLSEALAI